MKTGTITSGFASAPANGGRNNANVSITKMDHHFVAMTESPDVVEFDPFTLHTVGVLPYSDDLPAHYTTAHPHYDFKQKGLINFTIQFGATCRYHIYWMPAGSRKRVPLGSIETSEPAYMHSFGVTENYIVLVEFPLIFNLLELFEGKKPIVDCLHWTPQRGTRFLIVEKQSGKLEKVFETDSFFSFHLINAFEKQGDIFIDVCAMKSVKLQSLSVDHMGSMTFNRSAQPVMLRYHLSRESSVAKAERLSEEYLEFPGIHYKWSNAQDYHYAYGISTNRKRPENVENQLIKVDTRNGKTMVWTQEGHYPGEPVFAPSPAAKSEDDGVILSVVCNGNAGHSYLLVLNADTFEEIGRAEVPHHIPYGFHGIFTNELFLEEGRE
jgi:carotenoid cleavage dioxygenase-like enzyme